MNTEQEQKKECLARYWREMRNQPTERDPEITYNERFKQMYGETLVEYRNRLRSHAGTQDQQARHEATKRFYREGGR